MRHYASLLGADVELWGVTGLLHDLDYEQHPDEHPLFAVRLLEEQGWDGRIVRAIASHYAAKTGVEPESSMERHLVACDELSGFVLAVAYVRPSRSLAEVEVRSVMKKLKQPAFAAAVSREEIQHGAEQIGRSLEDHVDHVLTALRSAADSLIPKV